MDRTDWSDSRLNELSIRVDRNIGDLARRQDALDAKINGLPVRVEHLAAEVSEIKRELTAEDGAVGKLSKKVDEIIGNPVLEKRQRNQALVVNLLLIIGTTIVTYLVYIAAGAHP